MILYSASLSEFRNHVDNNLIVDHIFAAFQSALGYNPSPNEIRSWNNSMRFMETAVRRAELPDDCGVLIEYKIPTTSNRIDFMLTGYDESDQENFVLVELKQWEKAVKANVQYLVNTYVGGGNRNVTHPSNQAKTYVDFLSNINASIQDRRIMGHACAYLHNYTKQNPEPLLDDEYKEFTQAAPVFFKTDARELQAYLKKYLSKGNGLETRYYIEKGKLRPSKKLIEAVAGLFKGNSEFILLDEQIVAYHTIVEHCLNNMQKQKKKVIIVEGGPGTGKSVVALHVFRELLEHSKHVNFVAPNSAFREVMIVKLAKGKYGTKSFIKGLFNGSAGFYNKPTDMFDALIVDEAHRLKNEKAFQYRGENQVDDVIDSALTSVFFIDDGQQIRPEDIGCVSELERIAHNHDAEVVKLKLSSQFRCNGAEGYINWVTDVLQIEHTGNAEGWDQGDFDFRICESPHEVVDLIRKQNTKGYTSRVLAGYAWPWTTIKNGNDNAQINDVVIESEQFAMPWNSRSMRSTWAINPEGVNQVGCIHTSQGLEFDYVGVLFGKDIKFNQVTQQIYGDYNASFDSRGKANLKNEPGELTRLIKNIYKILCSRGMRGCYVYIEDKALRQYFKNRYSAVKRNEYDLEQEKQEVLRVADIITDKQEI